MKTIDAALMRASTIRIPLADPNWLTNRTLPGIRPTLERSGEREAREKLERDVTDIKVVAYDELRHLERLSPEALQQAGYADLAAATQLVMQLAKQGILAKHTEFRARYPVR